MASKYTVIGSFVDGNPENGTYSKRARRYAMRAVPSWKTGRFTLFSYSLPIAEFVDGILMVHDHTSGGIGFQSQTTSQHVGDVRRFCAQHNIAYILNGDPELAPGEVFDLG